MQQGEGGGTVIRIESLVREVGDLVSFPDVHLRLSERLADPDTSNKELAALINRDPSLTLRVLRIANSPLYGLSRQIEAVDHAVTLLGRRQLEELVLATSASRVIDGIPNVVYDMGDFWHHSIFCGLTARELARRCRHVEADFAFVAGLLHDIGQLILFHHYPGQSRVALERAMDPVAPLALYQAERRVFGFDHAMLGGRLLAQWLLPERLRECVEFHHEPQRAEHYPVEVALLHIANAVTSVAGTAVAAADAVEAIDGVCWQHTGLDPAEIPAAVEVAGRSVEEIRALFTA